MKTFNKTKWNLFFIKFDKDLPFYGKGFLNNAFFNERYRIPLTLAVWVAWRTPFKSSKKNEKTNEVENSRKSAQSHTFTWHTQHALRQHKAEISTLTRSLPSTFSCLKSTKSQIQISIAKFVAQAQAQRQPRQTDRQSCRKCKAKHQLKQATCQPSSQDANQPTSQPTKQPGNQPASKPASEPTSPASQPTRQQASTPTKQQDNQASRGKKKTKQPARQAHRGRHAHSIGCLQAIASRSKKSCQNRKGRKPSHVCNNANIT